MERQILIKASFVGTNYAGFQVQKNAPTIQGIVGDALSLLFSHKAPVTGCSRTDSGVHAKNYYMTTRTDSQFKIEKLKNALNANLPYDIAVTEAMEVPTDFHPRYDATCKRYRYDIWTKRHRNVFMDRFCHFHPAPFDIESFIKNAPKFVGRHDFCSFMSAGSSIEDTTRTIYSCKAQYNEGMLSFYVTGDGFLYNMVRIMVGTLIDGIDVTKAIEAKDRRAAGSTAPPTGLTLEDVYYPSLDIEHSFGDLVATGVFL